MSSLAEKQEELREKTTEAQREERRSRFNRKAAPQYKTMQAGKCKICQHPEALAINRALYDLESPNSVSKRFKVTRSTLERHISLHLADLIRRLQEKRQQKVLDELESITKQCELVIDTAMKQGDSRLALSAMAEQRQRCQLKAQLTGEIQAARENETDAERKRKMFEKGVEHMIQTARDQMGVELSREEAVKRLAAVDPELASYAVN